MPKLLIIDDEPLTVEMLQTFLHLNGYEAVGAYNGTDGLFLIPVERPDALILDLMLPDIDGYELCLQLRTLPQYAPWARIPVLVFSGRLEQESRVRAIQAGADVYLTKPVRFQFLLSEIERLIAARQNA